MTPMSENKKNRYNRWLSEVKEMADKYKITLGQAVRIIDTPGIEAIRNLLHWTEADEFIGYYLYKDKTK